VSAGRGPKGDGFTGGSYESSTGVVTFTSNDGIGFSTGDLRGDLSEPGPIGDVTPAAISGTTGTFSGDFTVDTDTLYVDSANNQVGIGTSSPGSALQVEGQITGTAVQQYPTDSTLSRVLLNRAHGLGASSAVQSVNDFSAVPIIPTGFYRTAANINNVTNPPPNSNYENSVGMVMRGFDGEAGILHMYSLDDGQPLRAWVGAKASDGDAVSWAELYSTGNTTVGAGGELLEASPIVRLFNSHIEEPNVPLGATMERAGLGHYVLTGTPPLATRGWQMRGAQTPNGDVICRIDNAVFSGGELHVFTSDADGHPADVPDDLYVMLRFWEAKEEGETAPDNAAITDDALANILENRRKALLKAECTKRILAVASHQAQANLTQAMVAYTGEVTRGQDEAEAEALSGLTNGDFASAKAAVAWRKEMVAACRDAILSGGDPVWPEAPEGVADLMDRM